MSDAPGGLDWWRGADGKWRPPEERPEPGAAGGSGVPAPKPVNPAGKGCLITLVILAAVVVWAFATSDDEPSGDDLEFAAFDVCTQFVKDQLRAPSTASFPNFVEDDGEVVVTSTGDYYTVRSQVDSENGFGATLTHRFTCEVRHTDDTRFVLVDLQII